MKDIKTFVKLFDLNVPEFNHFDYYISQYSRLDRFKDLKNKIELYLDFESLVDDPFLYKTEKAQQIINYLESSGAFNDLNDDNLIPDLPITKNFEYVEGQKYISVDINSANWYVLKTYDPDWINELGNSWEEFLSKFDIHPVFNNSKQFRQFIFGHLNPKKQIKVQRLVIEKFIKDLDLKNLKIICIRQDEVIFSFENWSDVDYLIKIVDSISHFKYRLFTVEKKNDFRINSFYDKNGNFLHKELSGCNGNKYFIFLKKYILNEPLDIRDLYFRIDGDLAIWDVDGLKLGL